QVDLVRVQAGGGDAEEREAEGGEDPHQEDGPAEVGDSGAHEWVKQGNEEQRGDDDAAEERDDIGELEQRAAEAIRKQAYEVERGGLEVMGAHDRVSGAAG